MKLVKNIILLLVALTTYLSSNAQEVNEQNILASLGQSSKWNSINYILFTSSSNTQGYKERSFLIDKSSGKVRFEGKTNSNLRIVLLFNFKTKAIDKCFINGRLDDSKTLTSFQEINSQLFEDTKLLFLPMLVISAPKKNVTINPGKIINAEKLFEINFKGINNLNKQPLNGTIYLNTKGDIKEYKLDNSTFLVSDIKDIGDGILLPTQFISKSSPSVNIKFNTVAAFTSIEAQKFNSL